jgi:hypothetical protein
MSSSLRHWRDFCGLVPLRIYPGGIETQIPNLEFRLKQG